MYQLLIEDRNIGERYLSSIVLSEKDLAKYNPKVFAQKEHLRRNPDDNMLELEHLELIFSNIFIVGYVKLNYEEINL